MVAVNYDDLELAFEYVNARDAGESSAYVSLDTGKTYIIDDSGDGPLEDVPDDVETSDRYVEVPHKNDLDLGRDLVFRFADQYLPQQRERIADFFRRRGAYARFKDFLASQNRLDDWYAFEGESTRRALVEWAKASGLQLVTERPSSPA